MFRTLRRILVSELGLSILDCVWFGLVWLCCPTTESIDLETGDVFVWNLSPVTTSLPNWPGRRCQSSLQAYSHLCTALLPRQARIANPNAMLWSLISSVRWPVTQHKARLYCWTLASSAPACPWDRTVQQPKPEWLVASRRSCRRFSNPTYCIGG